MSSVNNIVSEVSFSECLNRYPQLVMVTVTLYMRSYQVKINEIK